MELKISVSGGGLKVPVKGVDFGIGAFNALSLQIKQGFIVHQFVMESSVSFGFEGTLGVSMAITEWFTVADPNKNVLFKEFDGKFGEISLTPHWPKPTVDVEFQVYDENDQESYYKMNKVVNVRLQRGATLIQTNFFLRQPLKLYSVKGWHGKEDSLLAMR